MQFKRRCLVPARTLVNAGIASSVLLLAACGGGDPATTDDAPPSATVNGMDMSNSRGPALMLPAVWSTRPLARDVRDIALAGGAASTLAVAYERGGLEFFNLEAERITDMAEVNVRALSQGGYLEISQTGLVLFPGVNGNGDLAGYLHATGLPAPQEITLPVEMSGPVAGLCSRGLGFDRSGILELAVWSDGDARVTRGTIVTDGEDFDFVPATGAPETGGATSCAFIGGQLVLSDTAEALASLTREDSEHLVTLARGGNLSAGRPGEDQTPVSIREGLSVSAPATITALDALGQPFGGGYPAGVIVIAGDTGRSDQVVFVDAAPLTRGPGAGAGE